MFIHREDWESEKRKCNELERRVKRLELIMLEEAQGKIDRLADKGAGSGYDSIYSVESMIQMRRQCEKCKGRCEGCRTMMTGLKK